MTKEEALKFANENGTIPKGFENDKEVVLAAVKRNGYALYYASDELRGDPEFVKKCVEKRPESFTYALDDIITEYGKNRDVVLAAVKQDGDALYYASDELRGDPEFVKKCVKKCPFTFIYASDTLREKYGNDKDFILAAVKKWGWVLEYASEDLKNDREFIKECVKLNGLALEHVLEKFRYDEEVSMLSWVSLMEEMNNKTKTAKDEQQEDLKEKYIEKISNNQKIKDIFNKLLTTKLSEEDIKQNLLNLVREIKDIFELKLNHSDSIEDLFAGELKEGLMGEYNDRLKKVRIKFTSNQLCDVSAMIDAIFHEMRHAYQYQKVNTLPKQMAKAIDLSSKIYYNEKNFSARKREIYYHMQFLEIDAFEAGYETFSKLIKECNMDQDEKKEIQDNLWDHYFNCVYCATFYEDAKNYLTAVSKIAIGDPQSKIAMGGHQYLWIVPPAFRADKDFMLTAIYNGGSLRYASEDLKNDKDVVLAAVKQDGGALEYASEDLKNDKEVVLAAVEQNGYALKYASYLDYEVFEAIDPKMFIFEDFVSLYCDKVKECIKQEVERKLEEDPECNIEEYEEKEMQKFEELSLNRMTTEAKKKAAMQTIDNWSSSNGGKNGSEKG